MKTGDTVKGTFKVMSNQWPEGTVVVTPIHAHVVRKLTLTQGMAWLGTLYKGYVMVSLMPGKGWAASYWERNPFRASERVYGATPLKAIIALRKKLGVTS